jgi:Protein of unknown function (DUF4236)
MKRRHGDPRVDDHSGCVLGVRLRPWRKRRTHIDLVTRPEAADPGLRNAHRTRVPNVSVGVRSAHVTFGRRGITPTVGIPGTGVFYTSRTGHHSGAHSTPSPQAIRAGLERKLEQLHRAGLLTDEELAAKKAMLNTGAAGLPQ